MQGRESQKFAGLLKRAKRRQECMDATDKGIQNSLSSVAVSGMQGHGWGRK